MINFLNPNLQSKVTCSAVADDAYSADNLISQNPQHLAQGFMAYHVTKPPIDLCFHLLCPIHVECVKLWPKLGSLKSVSFEIFVQNSEKETIKIAACTDLREDGIIFLRQNSDSPRQLLNFKYGQFFQTINSRKGWQTIVVRITKTARCVPVLQKIEIWGRPSTSCSDELKKEVAKLWSSKYFNISPQTNNLPSSSPKNSEQTKRKIEGDFNIPEEYLDSLTYDIMTIPLVLPCGKNIDKSTLDKYTKIEETYGRMPADPFTGLSFTSDRKPILDASLKSQIDKFFINNSNKIEIKQLPRTIGTKSINSSADYHPNVENRSKKIKIDQPNQLLSTKPAATINEAVENALKNITRFSQKSKVSSEHCVNDEICFKCRSGGALYQIELCNHLVCRTCLTLRRDKIKNDDDTSLVCSCGSQFSKTNVRKYHVSLKL